MSKRFYCLILVIVLIFTLLITGISDGGNQISKNDGSVYLSAIKQGTKGSLYWTNLYNGEERQRIPLYFFYMLGGLIFGSLGMTINHIFYLLGVIGAVLFVIAIYKFIDQMELTARAKLFVLIIAFTLNQGGISELAYPEVYPFNTLLSYPHLTLSSALYLFIVTELLNLYKHKDRLVSTKLLALNVLLGIIHPFMLFPSNFIHLVFMLRKLKVNQDLSLYDKIKAIIVNLTFSNLLIAPYCIYIFLFYTITSYSNEVSQGGLLLDVMFFKANITTIFLLIIGVILSVKFKLFRLSRTQFMDVFIIMVSIVICMLCPLPFQRRISEMLGFFIAVFLATIIIEKKLKILAIILVLINLINAVSFLHTQENYDVYVYSLPKEVVELQKYIDNRNIEGYFLADIYTAQFIPYISQNPVYVGHYALTLHCKEKLDRLYSDKTEAEWINFIEDNKFDFICLNKKDKLTAFILPAIRHLYTLLYENEMYILYGVGI